MRPQNQPPANTVIDSLIFIMLNFISIMSTTRYQPGNTKFVFTGRIGVRLGGSEYT